MPPWREPKDCWQQFGGHPGFYTSGAQSTQRHRPKPKWPQQGKRQQRPWCLKKEVSEKIWIFVQILFTCKKVKPKWRPKLIPESPIFAAPDAAAAPNSGCHSCHSSVGAVGASWHIKLWHSPTTPSTEISFFSEVWYGKKHDFSESKNITCIVDAIVDDVI